MPGLDLLESIAAPALLVASGAKPVCLAVNAAFHGRTGLDAAAMNLCMDDGGIPAEDAGCLHRALEALSASGSEQICALNLPFDGQPDNRLAVLLPLDRGEVLVVLAGLGQGDGLERLLSREALAKRAILAEAERFVAMAAHDLRTPMRNVLQLLKMLRDAVEAGGEVPIEFLDLLEHVAHSTASLIDDTLACASAIEIVDSRTVFELAALSAPIFEALDPLRRHRLSVGEAMIDADRAAVQIVLRNLVDNAIKHGARASLTLRVSARMAGPGRIELTVVDDGAGFPEEALDYLSGGELRYDTGFGLHGVRRLLTDKGGTLRVERDAETGGAAVRVTLPGRLLSAPCDGAVP